MNLPNYITFSHDSGQYILSTTKPYSIGQIWKCRSQQELSLKMEEFRNNGKTVAPVQGYCIFIMWDDYLLNGFQFVDEQEQVNLMAAYYLQHIQRKPRTYARYEVKPYKPLFTHTEIEIL